MFIIFDLDDTLIDTSGGITPIKIEQALRVMQQAGCEISDFTIALEELLQLNIRAESAQEALKQFSYLYGIKENLIHVGLKELYGPLSEEFCVAPFEGAREVISFLSKKHNLAIVSIGKKDQQLFKLKKAGIDSAFFYKIVILEEKNKKKYYQQLMDEIKISPSEVVVCGDRILLDLVPAKELGCTTVHIKQGRGVYSTGPEGSVDFTISRLQEIIDVLVAIQKETKA